MNNPRIPDDDDYFFNKLRGNKSSMTGMEYNGTNNSNNHNNTMPIWSMILLCTGVAVVFIVWCIYLSFCAYSASQASPDSSSNQQDQDENSKPLSRKERRQLIMEYFVRSGNQMEVKAEHILTLNDEDQSDIEKGTVSEQDSEPDESIQQNDDSAKPALEDNEENGQVIILLLDKRKAPLAPDSDFTSPLEDEENGIRTSTDSRTDGQPSQGLTHESRPDVSVLSLAESQDKAGVSLDEFSVSCTDSNQLSTTTPLPLATSRQQYVSDSCAICLEPYQEGDVVVWSSTESCPHVFHKACFVDYLLSYRGPGTPCPSCRQTFIDECICNACKNRPKRNTSAEPLAPTPLANISTIESVNTATSLNVQQNES